MDEDAPLVDRLRAGDDGAFALLIGRYQPRMLRLAEATVGSRAVAEEVTQETWLAVIRGIDGFAGRSTFKTWLFHVLANRARTAASRERRAGRPDDHLVERWDCDGGWRDRPDAWADRADDRLAAARDAARVHELLPRLPDAQRRIVLLRDVEGLTAHAVSALVGVTEGNQRVLLHRGRARLRKLLAGQPVGGAEALV